MRFVRKASTVAVLRRHADLAPRARASTHRHTRTHLRADRRLHNVTIGQKMERASDQLSGCPLRLPAIESPDSSTSSSYSPYGPQLMQTFLSTSDQCECACAPVMGNVQASEAACTTHACVCQRPLACVLEVLICVHTCGRVRTGKSLDTKWLKPSARNSTGKAPPAPI